MEKAGFLTKVADVMKGMISHENMMASIQRSCMRGEAVNLDLMSAEEKRLDELIAGINDIKELEISENVMDALVLRYLKNTQFLFTIKEDDIDASGLKNDLHYWKRTMLYKAP